MDLASNEEGQTLIELIVIANIVGTLVLLLWCE
jgi:Tfp pilus assembly protein PilE